MISQLELVGNYYIIYKFDIEYKKFCVNPSIKENLEFTEVSLLNCMIVNVKEAVNDKLVASVFV